MCHINICSQLGKRCLLYVKPWKLLRAVFLQMFAYSFLNDGGVMQLSHQQRSTHSTKYDQLHGKLCHSKHSTYQAHLVMLNLHKADIGLHDMTCIIMTPHFYNMTAVRHLLLGPHYRSTIGPTMVKTNHNPLSFYCSCWQGLGQ